MWMPPIFEFGLRHHPHYTKRLYYAILHAPAYSILPSIAGGLAFHLGEKNLFPRTAKLKKQS